MAGEILDGFEIFPINCSNVINTAEQWTTGFQDGNDHAAVDAGVVVLLAVEPFPEDSVEPVLCNVAGVPMNNGVTNRIDRHKKSGDFTSFLA